MQIKKRTLTFLSLQHIFTHFSIENNQYNSNKNFYQRAKNHSKIRIMLLQGFLHL